jgi:hypothetical protein
MEAILRLTKDRTTHIVAVAALILGILQGLDVFTVPAEAWPILGALGLSRLRSGVTKVAREIEKERKDTK